MLGIKWRHDQCIEQNKLSSQRGISWNDNFNKTSGNTLSKVSSIEVLRLKLCHILGAIPRSKNDLAIIIIIVTNWNIYAQILASAIPSIFSDWGIWVTFPAAHMRE